MDLVRELGNWLGRWSVKQAHYPGDPGYVDPPPSRRPTDYSQNRGSNPANVQANTPMESYETADAAVGPRRDLVPGLTSSHGAGHPLTQQARQNNQAFDRLRQPITGREVYHGVDPQVIRHHIQQGRSGQQAMARARSAETMMPQIQSLERARGLTSPQAGRRDPGLRNIMRPEDYKATQSRRSLNRAYQQAFRADDPGAQRGYLQWAKTNDLAYYAKRTGQTAPAPAASPAPSYNMPVPPRPAPPRPTPSRPPPPRPLPPGPTPRGPTTPTQMPRPDEVIAGVPSRPPTGSPIKIGSLGYALGYHTTLRSPLI